MSRIGKHYITDVPEVTILLAKTQKIQMYFLG